MQSQVPREGSCMLQGNVEKDEPLVSLLKPIVQVDDPYRFVGVKKDWLHRKAVVLIGILSREKVSTGSLIMLSMR